MSSTKYPDGPPQRQAHIDVHGITCTHENLLTPPTVADFFVPKIPAMLAGGWWCTPGLMSENRKIRLRTREAPAQTQGSPAATAKRRLGQRNSGTGQWHWRQGQARQGPWQGQGQSRGTPRLRRRGARRQRLSGGSANATAAQASGTGGKDKRGQALGNAEATVKRARTTAYAKRPCGRSNKDQSTAASGHGVGSSNFGLS